MAVKTTLMIGIHNHQPVGNFDKVFEAAYNLAYVTLLDHLDRHPSVKVALHYSGSLLEWLDAHHPDFLDRVKEVVDRGQAEMMSGGFFEPILPVLPPHDAVTQITMLTDYVRRRFGYEAKGFWLAERVWEPIVPTLAADAGGLRYTVLDQSHFLTSGVGKDDANGYYMTEDQGNPLAVFPIDYRLRYAIPWEVVQATIDYLKDKHDAAPGRGWTFADDGEKFGSWPETWENVIETGWFDDLFTAIEDAGDWLETKTFSEFLAERPPSGRAYLPTGSYPEMLRWSLPPHVGERIEEFLESLPEGDDKDFVQAGFWRNFMAKYPEANNLHKRMIRASRRVAASRLDAETVAAARAHVLRSQCNCPYWHGVFGGLYLNFLRHATYAEMLEAEKEAAPVKKLVVEETDFDADGQAEVIVANPAQALIISPHTGGALREWDWYAFPTNIIDTLARRRELYHAKIERLEVKAKPGQAEIEMPLPYDRYNRWCMIDVFPAPGTTHDAFAGMEYTDEGAFATAPYSYRIERRARARIIAMECEGTVRRGAETWPMRVTKRVEVAPDAPGMVVTYTLTNLGKLPYKGIFGSEWNFGLLAAQADDRYYLIDGRRGPGDMRLGTSGAHEAVREFALVDHWQGLDIRLKPSVPAHLWRYPVETVSLSEEGYETTYQASAVFPYWEVSLEPGAPWTVVVLVRVLEPQWHPPEVQPMDAHEKVS